MKRKELWPNALPLRCICLFVCLFGARFAFTWWYRVSGSVNYLLFCMRVDMAAGNITMSGKKSRPQKLEIKYYMVSFFLYLQWPMWNKHLIVPAFHSKTKIICELVNFHVCDILTDLASLIQVDTEFIIYIYIYSFRCLAQIYRNGSEMF